MIVTKNISFSRMLGFTGRHFLWLIPLMGSIALLYHFNVLDFKIPWVPISVIGTAVAFYVGFKNNQSYDRLWEARKIWGGIVNASRSWTIMVKDFINNDHAKTPLSEDGLRT